MQVYLDNSATTRVSPASMKAVQNAMEVQYGNPSSMHLMGVESERIVRESSEKLAALMRVKAKELFYTSGGTESDNWAILGAAAAAVRRGKHIVISSVEHPAVSAPAHALEEQGYEVTVLPVLSDGSVDPAEAEAAVRDDTVLVSVMYVNNEIGTVQPVREIGERIKRKNPEVLFHVDAVQAFGKIPVRPREIKADLLSVSSHKIHGPKGVGFLYIRDGVRIRPIIHGGGQQNGMRSGTDNVPGIAGMAAAAEEACGRLEEKASHMRKLADQLRRGMEARISPACGVVFHTPPENAAPHILNVSFPGIRSEVLLHALEEKGIFVSAGSACSSHKRSGSPTLTAVGCPKGEIESALRFSLCADNTQEEIEYTLQSLEELVPVLARFTRR